jgi:hypothetical protein
MQPSESQRALAAAMPAAPALDLTAGDAVVLHHSNRLAVRLLPCDVLARVAPAAHQGAPFEAGLAQRLTGTESPVAALEPRAGQRVHERDGFVITLWTCCKPVPPREASPADYADALERLHAGLRRLDARTPHFTDRVAAAQQLAGEQEPDSGAGRRGSGASHQHAAEPQASDRPARRCRAAAARRAAPRQRAQHDDRAVVHRSADMLPRARRVRPRPCPPKMPASATRTLMKNCPASAAPLFSPRSPHGAGIRAANSRTGSEQAVNSSAHCARARPGQRPTP